METREELEKLYIEATKRLMKAEKNVGSLLTKELTDKNKIKLEEARLEMEDAADEHRGIRLKLSVLK
jgi:hypothetical protein